MCKKKEKKSYIEQWRKKYNGCLYYLTRILFKVGSNFLKAEAIILNLLLINKKKDFRSIIILKLNINLYIIC